MALPTIVGSGAAAASTGAITPDLPAGVETNDLLLLFVETVGSESISVSDAGWTAAPNSPINLNTGSNTRLSVFWKRAGAAETAPTTTDSGDHQIGAIMAVRGCVTKGNPFLVTASGSTSAIATKTGANNLWPLINNVLVINAFAQGDDGQTTGQFSSFTNASLGSLTERIDAFTDLGNGGGLAVATGTKATPGLITGTTVTCSFTTAGVQWSGCLIPDEYDNKPIVRSRGSLAGNTTAISPGLPNGWQQNDLLLVFVETNNQAITISGYTEAGSSPASNAGTNPTRLTVFYKWAGASESAPTTSDSGDHQVAEMLAIRNGRGTGEPFDVTASTAGGTSSSVIIGGATTTSNNTLVLAAVASTVDGYGDDNLVFTNWANSDLTEVTEVLDFANSSSTGGAVGVAAGYKTAAGTYGNTTVTQISAVEYATWTGAILGPLSLSADAGTLTLTPEDVTWPFILADATDLTVTGANAQFTRNVFLTAAAGAFTCSSNTVSLIEGYYLLADVSPVTATGADAISEKNIRMAAEAGNLAIFSADTQILAGTPEKYTLGVIVDLIPAQQNGNYQKYTQRLLVNGRPIPVNSWSFDEAAGIAAGTLTVTLANVADRQYLNTGSNIQFELGEWINNQWRWMPLINTGSLRTTNYALMTAENGPADTITLTASSRLADLLNAAPLTRIVWYDPDRQDIDPEQIEGIVKLDGSIIKPVINAIKGLDIHYLIRDCFQTGCGFSQVFTNIPNFPVSIAMADPGNPYPNVVGPFIGIFEPQMIATGVDGLTLSIRSGIAPMTGGSVSLATDYTNTLGVNNEVSRIKGLGIDISLRRLNWDKTRIVETQTRQTVGDTGGALTDVNTELTTTTKTREYFNEAKPEIPVREEIIAVETSTATVLNSGLEETASSVERFYYDNFGRLISRRKLVKARLPNPESDFAFTGLIDVMEENERIGYALHPYQPKQSYRIYRELNTEGLILIDGDNQQLGEDYSRAAIDAYRSGNVVETMTSDWGKINTIREDAIPRRKESVIIRTLNIDYLAGQYVLDDREEKIGLISTNMLIDERRRFYLFGADPNGIVEIIDLGDIPLRYANYIGQAVLNYRQRYTRTVQSGVIGLNLGLQRGMDVRLYGRNAEFIGSYRILGRRFDGNENGYTTTLTLRG